MKSKKSNDLSFVSFLKYFAAEVFQVDSRISRTIITLLTKPGYLTLEYFKSSKEKYVQPLRLYFIINFVFFLIVPILSTPQFQIFSFNLKSLSSNNKVYKNIVNEQIRENNVSAEIYEERFNAHLKYNQPALVFLIVPLFALLLKIVFFNKKRYYLEHLFFSFHFLSFFLISLLIAIFLYRFSTFILSLSSVSSGFIAAVILILLLLWLVFYLFLSVKTFYMENILSNVIKFPFVFVGFFISLGVYTQFLFFYTIIALN
jgi:hypothetical protein